MNIYDCFMYFDEDMLLDLRLNVLNDHVKKFVITEATYTHNGSKKKLNFDINNYKKFRDKIIKISNKDGIKIRPVWRPLHKSNHLKHFAKMNLSNTTDLENRIINLPSGPEVLKILK